MKVLHINASDSKGGAARAAYRLHSGLKKLEVESQMLVQYRLSSESGIIAPSNKILEGLAVMRLPLDSLPLKLYPKRLKTSFSVQWLPDRIMSQVEVIKPDIIHLHWINQGTVRLETLRKFRRPIVWTLHDMWPFTGGCHYSDKCTLYHESCGSCPQLFSNKEKDLSRLIWVRKSKSWEQLNLTVVSPSQWLSACARSSSLFSNKLVETIPHGLDLEKYKPIEKKIAREILGLPTDKHILLFGSINATSDPRKGFNLLSQALEKIALSEYWQQRIDIAVLGTSRRQNDWSHISFPIHQLGSFSDDISLAIVYSAASITVTPSIQEAFGQVAFESTACGTPVVGFSATGLLDVIIHREDGYLAKPYEVEDLAKGIIWVLEDKERYDSLRLKARMNSADKFSIELQARRYLNLYKRMLKQSATVS